MEHPFYGSWGYQVTGYFAPTSRYGTPQDFMYLVDTLHQAGIGVILDWVPSHFPSDEHGLGYFDGTHLYEHADLRQGFHPDWRSCIFNYGRHEVRSFLLSSGLFWLDRYHVDGLRVDAVASMLYLDYSRKAGEWIPNEFGGRENIGRDHAACAASTTRSPTAHPDMLTIAEESTAWPMVSRPTYVGGLGFGMKWDLGWMHDTLDYLSMDPIHPQVPPHGAHVPPRSTQYTENFVLPLSHDEVVHGKGSLLSKMPGDEWQKFANLRLLFAYHVGAAGQEAPLHGRRDRPVERVEPRHEPRLAPARAAPPRGASRRWVGDLNRLYRERARAARAATSSRGASSGSTATTRTTASSSFERRGRRERRRRRRGVQLHAGPARTATASASTSRGDWSEIANSDAAEYGGSGVGNQAALGRARGARARPLAQPRAHPAAARRRLPRSARRRSRKRKSTSRPRRPSRRAGRGAERGAAPDVEE